MLLHLPLLVIIHLQHLLLLLLLMRCAAVLSSALLSHSLFVFSLSLVSVLFLSFFFSFLLCSVAFFYDRLWLFYYFIIFCAILCYAALFFCVVDCICSPSCTCIIMPSRVMSVTRHTSSFLVLELLFLFSVSVPFFAAHNVSCS